MADSEVPAWLKNLPLAPEYRPTETEFADPIAFISRIEREAAAFGICKVIPPLPKPSRKFVLANLNRSLSASPDLPGAAAAAPRRPGAVFTTRHQELGSRRARAPAPASASACTQKQVWQSGEFYTLEQFEAKSKAFARSQLGAKEVSPMLVESLFWKAASEKPIYVEYANDVPGSAFAAPEEPFRYVSYRRRKRKRGFDGGTAQELKRSPPEPVPAERVEGAGGAGWKLSNSPWNLQVIARSPGSLTRFMPDEIPGVTSPMVYIGMLFSWFAWHVEDHELHSLNFLHIGAPKTWYAVPGDYAANLEEIVRFEGYGGNVDRLAALTMLGEKTTLLSPEILVASGLPCCRLVQHPGEFVVTFPRAYHVGFSHGFNCGEAANFATPQWLKVAKEAAVRRAAMNYLPMLSHQQLLYMLTMSFIPSAPGEVLSGARTSRLRDRKKEEREIMVKKAFLDDMMKEENLFFALLARESTCYAVLWEPELLPAPSVVDAHGWKMMHCSSRKDSLCDKANDCCVQNEEVTSNLLSQSAPTVSSMKCQNDEDHKNCSNTQIEEVDDIDASDLPFDLNIDSGSLACVACGILGYPLMAILQPSDNASKELFPFSDEDSNEAYHKSQLFSEGSLVPCTINKIESDLGKHTDRSSEQKIPDICSNLGTENSGHASLHEGSNTIGESSSHFSEVPNMTNAANDANSRNSCDSGPANVSATGCLPITSVETGKSGENMSNVHEEDELYQKKENARCTSEDNTKHAVDVLGLSDGMDRVGAYNSSNINSLSSSGKSDEQLSLNNGECLKEATTKKHMEKTAKWTTSKGFLRPRIFCLQHALEIEELLHARGGARVLLICHTDYLKIKALAISIAEEINVPLSGKDVPFDNASSADLDIINISIDDEGHEEDGKDWTSRLGLNLKYCVKLRKQSTSNQECLTLALDGIDSDPSPVPFVSNLKWLSRKPRTPYKVIGTTVSKSVVRNSIDDSSYVIKAYNCEIRSSGKDNYVSSQKVMQQDSGTNDTAQPVDGDERSTHNRAQASRYKLLDSESRLFTIPIIVAEYPQAHQVSWEIPQVGILNEFQGEFSSTCELAHSENSEDFTLGCENSKDMKIISTLDANENVKPFYEPGSSSNNENIAVAWKTCSVSNSDRMLSEDRLVCPTLLPNNSEMHLQVKTAKAPSVNVIGANPTNTHGSEIDVSGSPSKKEFLPEGNSGIKDEVVHINESRHDVLVNGDSKMQMETPLSSDANDLVKNKVKSAMNNLTEIPSAVQEVIENPRNFCPAKNASALNDVQGNNAQSSRHDLIPYVRRKKRSIEKNEKEACPDSAIGFIRSPCEGLRPRSRQIPDTINADMDKAEKKVTDKHRGSGYLVGSKCKRMAFKCDIEGCHMSFDTKRDLNLHKHNRCTFEGCRKLFSSHASLVRHQCVHNDDRPFKCPWNGCNMSFKWQWAKIEHVRLHTGERPYVCKVSGCGLTFRFVSDFSRHRRKTGHRTNPPENL